MDLTNIFNLSTAKILTKYFEFLNNVRVARGEPRVEHSKLLLYIFKMSTAPTSLLLMLSYVAYAHHRVLSLYYVIPLSIAAFFTIPVFLELLRYVNYIRNLREDLTYFMIIDGMCPGDDLIKDLEEDSEAICSFLPSLCIENSRLKLFMKFFPGVRGVKEYVLRAPKPMRKLLLEYVTTRESASFSTWVYSKYQEALREVKVSARNSLELKTILSLTAVIFSGLTPPIIALTALVMGGQEVLYAYPLITLPAVAMAISERSVPRILKVPSGSRRLKVSAALSTLSLSISPVIGLRNSVAIAGVVFLVLGVVASVKFIRAYLELISIPSQLVILADKLPYSDRPLELVRESLGEILGRSVFTSVCYYMLFKAVKKGDIDSARIIAFKDVVEELFSLVKQSAAVRALVVATAIFLPFVSIFSISLAVSMNTASSVLYLYYFTSSLFYSVIATHTAFGTLENTFLVGLVMIELYTLGVVP